MPDKLTLTDLATLYSDEDKAREKLEKLRWPNGAVCAHCESAKVYRLIPRPESKTAGRKGLWKCSTCGKQFTVTVNTIFEGTRIPLGKWIMAIYLICSSKKGISALQLMRMLWPDDVERGENGKLKKTHYKTAWFMAHRIRYAMTQEPLFSKLNGVVEADETYIGGKFKNMHPKERLEQKALGADHKAPVITLVERGGRVRTRHMEHVTASNIKEVMRDYVSAGDAFLMTDEALVYKGLDVAGHQSVNHVAKEYVRGVVHVNTAESVHALLKRGVMGIYHHWSKKHLHRYLSEFDFRWNYRKMSDGERTAALFNGIEGKRLRYADPTQFQDTKTEVLSLDEMQKLYLEGKMTLEAIAERTRISRQAVHSRLTHAGVKMRDRGWRQPNLIPKETLIDLYVNKRLPRYKVAKELCINVKTLNNLFDHYGIKPRPVRSELRKHPELAELKVDESLILNAPKGPKKCHMKFYMMAKRYGIRISIKRVDAESVRVTRVE